MIVEIYADESRYFCPDHPQVSKYEYKANISDEMAKKLIQNSKLIRPVIFAGLTE